MELEEDEERLPVVPLGDRKLRACLVTGLVKTEEQASLDSNMYACLYDLPENLNDARVASGPLTATGAECMQQGQQSLMMLMRRQSQYRARAQVWGTRMALCDNTEILNDVRRAICPLAAAVGSTAPKKQPPSNVVGRI